MMRDAGVLLGHSALVAAALGLGFRILGSSGSPSSESIVCNLSFRPMATGLGLDRRERPIYMSSFVCSSGE